ncbi:hypothetical protein Syun_030539 [Stephania yunnanensis]|uniref:Uncharacterized protein n=1 Tax=Stephania yunnanensis TaxID=152371 RepID=A0AAP0DU52_9MAGN
MTYNANDTKFSSPMPVIGLYVAGATLVCLLLMLCDIFSAIRQRKPWIPCHFFVLNSFTLTLLSVVTKICGDLNTSMPSALDQLSKLCGTSLACISIGFFRPSIVNMQESELSANLAALTLMVITIIANISLQISTGAIFLFKAEHVINLVLMLLLLSLTACVKSRFTDYFTESFRRSIKHMPRNIRTLKRCYMFSYFTSPQLLFCRFSHVAAIGMLCTVCCVVLLQAMVRAYRLDLGTKEVSDYKWSIWAVVGLQILTLNVGILAVVFRCIALASQMHSPLFSLLKETSIFYFYQIQLLIHRNWELYYRALNYLRVVFKIFRVSEHILWPMLVGVRIWAVCMDKPTVIMILAARDCFAWFVIKSGIDFGFSNCSRGDEGVVLGMLKKEFSDTVSELKSIPDFYSDHLLWKSYQDMEKCIKEHSTNSMHCLHKFLGKPHQSAGLLKQISKSSDELLILVCLARMAHLLAPLIPNDHSLVSALDQAFEVIVFIHENTKPTSVSSGLKVNCAKDIWMNRSINNHWFQNDFIKHLNKGDTSHFLDNVCGIVEKYMQVNLLCQEVSDIISIIGEPKLDIISDENMNELYDPIEQLFVEMLHSFIDRLPEAIFNSINESVPSDEFEINAKNAVKLIAKLNLVDAKSLCFTCSNMTSFMTTDTAERDNESGRSFSCVHDEDVNLRLPSTLEDDIEEAV